MNGLKEQSQNYYLHPTHERLPRLPEGDRREEGMGPSPKPIFDAELLTEIISQIKDPGNEHRKGR